MPAILFARQSKTGASAIGYSGERLKNLFARGAEGNVVLMGRGGALEHADVYQPVRAVVDHGGTLFAVSGGRLYSVSGAGVATNLGAVDDAHDTYMASSGTQLAIVANSKYYVWDGSTVAEYSTGALTAPRAVTYLDGYFVIIGTSGGRNDAFTISGLDDGKTFDATEFAFAENAPDELKGIIADHGQLWLMGTKTVEVWYNSGDIDFPFARNQGAQIEHGCLSGMTVAKADNAVFWVGADNVVYRSSGGAPQVVSTREVEEDLAGEAIKAGFSFTDRGHKFYAVRTESGPTYVYDMSTGLWHERTAGLTDSPWLCSNRATVGSTEFFGCNNGLICTLSGSAYTDAGTLIDAEAISIPIFRPDPFTVARVKLNIRGGVGGLGRQPRVMLQTTKDGRNWGVERWRDLGGLGEYYTGSWYGNGAFCLPPYSDRFQVRVRITDNVPRDIYGVSYD